MRLSLRQLVYAAWSYRSRLTGQRRLLNRLRPAGGVRTLGGPFEGMRYLEAATGSALSPKLLGTYEQEIAGWVEQAIRRDPEVVIDVGAAEGYYAVGLAWRLPGSRVVAFEMDGVGRQRLKQLAEMNGVASRVEVHGRCDAATLRSTVDKLGKTRGLLLMDVEGAEDELLSDAVAETFRGWFLLVQTHDFVHARVTQRLTARFRQTHRVEQIDYQPAGRARGVELDGFSRNQMEALAYEGRPEGMCWLWMEPCSPDEAVD